MNIIEQIDALRVMTVGQLRESYARMFGEAARSRHKEYLLRRLAWRLQSRAEGGLSERARRRAAELADEADVRVTPPQGTELAAIKPAAHGVTEKRQEASKPRDPRLPIAGSELVRRYRGRIYKVRVLDDGFEFAGVRYKSLSAVANAVTGTHTNGFRFFELQRHDLDPTIEPNETETNSAVAANCSGDAIGRMNDEEPRE